MMNDEKFTTTGHGHEQQKFTPGPWNVVEARGFTTNRKLIQSEDGEDIAATCYHDPEDTIANAALIAAAPELYEALKEAWFCPAMAGCVGKSKRRKQR